MPNVSPSSVTILTDSATCARVLAAYNRARGEAVTRLYVWQVGSYYDATDTAGMKPNQIDRFGHVVFDSTLTKVGVYLD